MDEIRMQPKDGKPWNDDTDPLQYLEHLSKVSQPVFHKQMFQLILYSVKCKIQLFQRSRLQLKGTYTAEAIAEGLNSDDVSKTIRSRRNGNYGGGTHGTNALLNAVHAVSKALPHTAEAAKKARNTAEAMMHHLGNGSVFVTVSFDDENSLLVILLSGRPFDGLRGDELDDVVDPRLQKEAAERHELRLEFPGITAVNFEVLFDIFLEEVIGWDRRNNKACERPGLFGECFALAIAFEEQGRKSVVSRSSGIWGFSNSVYYVTLPHLLFSLSTLHSTAI